MKKFLLPVVAFFVVAAANAQDNSNVWPMPKFPDPVPAGTSSTVYPVPRLDWVQRVQNSLINSQKKADEIKLIFDGDSITDGWQGNGRKIWAERYAKYGAFDFGISGDRTEHVLWRLSQGQAKGLNPKLIAIMIGTNNMGANKAEEIADGVKAIVAEYQKVCPDAVILLQAIFPRDNKPNTGNRAKIKAVNEIISKLDDGKKVIYIDFGDKFLDADGVLSPAIMPDYLHPSEKGYQIWADAIQPFIDKYMQ